MYRLLLFIENYSFISLICLNMRWYKKQYFSLEAAYTHSPIPHPQEKVFFYNRGPGSELKSGKLYWRKRVKI